MASTGSAACWSGSRTAQTVSANGSIGRRNSAESFACFMPMTRWIGRSAHPFSVPPGQHRRRDYGRRPATAPSPLGRSARETACKRCNRAGHSAWAMPAVLCGKAGGAEGGDRDAGVVQLEQAAQRRHGAFDSPAAVGIAKSGLPARCPSPGRAAYRGSQARRHGRAGCDGHQAAARRRRRERLAS